MTEQIKATNNNVFLIRDKTESEVGGLIIPNIGRPKPAKGTIESIGELVRDGKIKGGKGKKCLFHPGTGFEIDFNDKTYLVLQGDEIIAIV